MTLKKELEVLVGVEHVFDSPEMLREYSHDFSLLPSGLPNYVVQPKDAGEIQQVVRLANESKTPVIPCSSGVHFNGTTIPKQGGIVLDLKRMNQVLVLDERNRIARIEPGVTWAQLQTELKEHDLMAMSSLLPHPRKSVLTSYLEREVLTNTRYEYGEPLMGMQVVWPNGDIFRTGSASAPGFPECFAEGANPQGPGTLDFYRLFQCAQGTMGIVTWANIKVEHLPKVNKTIFMPFSNIEDAVEPIYRLGRRRIGYECFLLNRFNAAVILSENSPEYFERLHSTLPPWILILILSGPYRRPEERIEYEEEALKEIRKAEFPSLEILSALPGIPGVEKRLPNILRQPWPEEITFWKFQHRGACQDLSFITTLDMVSQFSEAVYEVLGEYGYDVNRIGHYIQPIEYGTGCHCEFNFYYNPEDSAEIEQVRKLYLDAAETLLNLGALFTRPYGVLAELVYSRATSYTMALKKVKSVFDPNNIMCPGNLCF